MTKRILLLGAAGQMGQAIAHEPTPAKSEIIACNRTECDIADLDSLRRAIQRHKPDLVINLAAMTAVDVCEKEKDMARAINFEGPTNLAALCLATDTPLIHISTDYVFDGRDGEIPYTTEFPMNPLSAYGETKMLGEEAIRHQLPWHVILRVSSVFSAYASNIFTKAIKSIDEKDELKIVTDQKSCPTHAPEIAKAILHMATEILGGKSDGFGTFHFCGANPANRLEFVQTIMDAYAPFTSRRPSILPALSSDFPGLAERPAYSVLDCEKIARVYGIQQKPWQDGIKAAMQTLMNARGKA